MTNLLEHPIVLKAKEYATEKHTGQKRKYTGEDYIVHPEEVATIVAGLPDSTPEMIAAAYLHDVVEDTDTRLFDITEEFGWTIAHYVGGLTDVSRPEHGNSSIVERDKEFAQVYMHEINLLHNALYLADLGLSDKVEDVIKQYYEGET
jgi:(p)ppGpp synthase/HD superfamily hydrolase